MNKWIGSLLATLLAVFWALPTGAAAANTKITQCAGWVIYGQHARIVAGIEKGFFKKAGLDVNFVRGFGSMDSMTKVHAGACDIGESSAGVVAVARVRGIKAKIFNMMMPKFTETLYYFAESGIKRLKDLEGKIITGGPKAAADILLWPLFAKVNGIDPGKNKVIYMPPAAKASSLGAGKVDAVIDFHFQLPKYEKVAKQAGKTLVKVLWADQGMDIYANGMIASDETLTKRADMVRRWLRAYAESEVWASRNREAAIDIHQKKYPSQSRAGNLRSQDLYFFHLLDANALKKGLRAHGPGEDGEDHPDHVRSPGDQEIGGSLGDLHESIRREASGRSAFLLQALSPAEGEVRTTGKPFERGRGWVRLSSERSEWRENRPCPGGVGKS
jgi:NitT/TauT family transport system substrate-binding protein